MNIDEMIDRIARAEEIQRYTENRCEVLEKENAELKAKLKEHESIGNAQFWENVWAWKTKADQLTKEKEIIKNLMVYVPVDLKEYEEAKQFLSEVK